MAINFKQSDALSQVNMTPMIDCIFQLLLFFMLASQFKDYEDQQIDSQLATASEATAMADSANDIIVDVNHEGKYFVRAQELDLDGLAAIFERASINNRLATKVFVRADKRVAYEYVVQVENLAKQMHLESMHSLSGERE
jgi:biopolymer transport protein ExbD